MLQFRTSAILPMISIVGSRSPDLYRLTVAWLTPSSWPTASFDGAVTGHLLVWVVRPVYHCGKSTGRTFLCLTMRLWFNRTCNAPRLPRKAQTMARSTKSTTEAPAVPVPARDVQCACGCGESVARTFKQGHDQVLISKLSSDLVYGDVWGGTAAGILKKTEVGTDIQDRINKVAEYMRAKLTEALATKFENAVARTWELEKSRTERDAAKAARKAEAAAKPKRATKAATPSEEAGDAPKPARKPRNTKPVATNADVDAEEAAADAATNGHKLGATVKVKIGKAARLRTATVTGMNQAGKVTAVTIKTGDRETVKTDGFVVVAD
jgi:hypothetical protein